MRRACGFVIAASLAGGAAAAADPGAGHAPAGAMSFELRYSAPPGCPTREAAIELIRERAPGARFSPGARRVLEVRVTDAARGYTGALAVDAIAEKQLAAARCDDLVTALALVIALAIDPDAAPPRAAPAGSAAAPAEGTEIDGAAATGAAMAPGAAMAAPAPAATPGAAMAAPAAAVAPAVTAAAPAATHPWAIDATIGGSLATGVTPDPLLAARLAARVTRSHLAAELALAAGHDSTRAAEGSAAFTQIVARPAACRLRSARSLELGACAHAELGLVRATGDDIVNARALTRLWAALGAHATLRWPARSRFFAQLQLGLTAPITRDRYRFMPGTVVHETAPVCGWLDLGLGVHFP